MRSLRVLLIAAVLVLFTFSSAGAQPEHVKATLMSVGGSGITGYAKLVQLKSGETRIHVGALGLRPGTEYVSLYYDNATCELEPYSAEDVIGGPYTANQNGKGHTVGNADDPLDEINSVSVRLASTFELLACATIEH